MQRKKNLRNKYFGTGKKRMWKSFYFTQILHTKLNLDAQKNILIIIFQHTDVTEQKPLPVLQRKKITRWKLKGNVKLNNSKCYRSKEARTHFWHNLLKFNLTLLIEIPQYNNFNLPKNRSLLNRGIWMKQFSSLSVIGKNDKNKWGENFRRNRQ